MPSAAKPSRAPRRFALLVALALASGALACSSDGTAGSEPDGVEEGALQSGARLFTTGPLRLRAEPRVDAAVVATVDRGVPVTVEEPALRDRYRHVRLATGETGYVFFGYLANGAPRASDADRGDAPGTEFKAKGTGYYPANNAMEGGFNDMLGKRLATLDDFLEGRRDYVSVAMDKSAFPYGTRLRIAELEARYERPIEFRVVDTGGAFTGKGRTRMDICVKDRRASLDATVNGTLTVTLAP